MVCAAVVHTGSDARPAPGCDRPAARAECATGAEAAGGAHRQSRRATPRPGSAPAAGPPGHRQTIELAPVALGLGHLLGPGQVQQLQRALHLRQPLLAHVQIGGVVAES